DITRAVLTQIIVEEESKGANLLPISFLKQLIGFYGDSMQTFVPRYLELSMESLAKNQEQVRDMVSRTFDQMFPSPTDAVDGMVRNNMAMMRRTMDMFYPEGDQTTDKTPDRDEDIRALQERIDSLQNQLDRISRNKS
ncbi:MAG: polyhydroxyalkanoate synthesis repressor PhaR, partial [bacterium]|nr:polyhydroxyalkanoate synthesis repressor PhaR [bacterium]